LRGEAVDLEVFARRERVEGGGGRRTPPLPAADNRSPMAPLHRPSESAEKISSKKKTGTAVRLPCNLEKVN